MTTLREAAQQALEALESADVDPHSSDAVYKAIADLQAALANYDNELAEIDSDGARCGIYRLPVKAALAEPVQEPVRVLRTLVQIHADGTETWREDPVWSAPPQLKPLTDETLWEMWVESPSDVLRFARAIERAHGIGGQDEP
jgi:hypothetical protein